MNEVSFISREHIEAMTQRILRDTNSDISLDNPTFPKPVPIEEIIDFYYQIDIEWDDIDGLDETGDVMAAIYPTQKKIVMNESQRGLFEKKIGTMKFTMAHELGHWVLHTEQGQEQLSMFETNPKTFFCRSNKEARVEKQANMFAGSILMPKPVITAYINKLKSSGAIQLRQLYVLAELFDVTISALKVRLHELKLLYISNNGNIYLSKEVFHGQVELPM